MKIVKKIACKYLKYTVHYHSSVILPLTRVHFIHYDFLSYRDIYRPIGFPYHS